MPKARSVRSKEFASSLVLAVSSNSNDEEIGAPINGDGITSPPSHLILPNTTTGLFLVTRSLQMNILRLSG
ncbi:hypothetical protein TNCV_518721 [Trichonephila clavipes]|nr:hypothetical protein TNCV_518721 [Trichonephila clavipes]